MTRTHVDTNAQTGEVTSRPYTEEEEAAANALIAADESAENNPLSARQLRLGLIRNGISLSTIQDAINQLPAPYRDEAQIYWEFSLEINWEHPMREFLMNLIGLDETSARAMWKEAMTYER